MNKVEISLFGRKALVDEDMVKKMLKKEQLVNRAKIIRQMKDLAPNLAKLAAQEESEIVRKIINLNRTIRQNVLYI